MTLLRSPQVAYIFMSFIVACGLVFGFQWFGWMGVGFVGLVGLLISLRAELFDACGDPLAQASVNAVKMYSKQIENQQMDNVDAVHRRQGKDLQRHIFHRAINTIFAAILMLGGSMFFLKEF